jgi:hypothetical protein
MPENRPACVRLLTTRGTFERELLREQAPRGLDEVSEKLRLITRRVWSAERQQAVIDHTSSLSGDISELTALLRATSDVDQQPTTA